MMSKSVPSQAPTLPLTTSTQQECPHSPGSCDKASHHPASLQASQMEDTQARKISHYRKLKPLLYPSYYNFSIVRHFCQTPVLGLGLGVDFINFIFAWDNNNNNNNPHRNFLKETVLGEDQGIGDKG